MKSILQDKYQVISSEDLRSFEFLSEGPNGTIKKVVLFQEFHPDYYNLAFGDWDEIKQVINDTSRTNNNDRDKVIATVAYTVVDFLTLYKDAIIVASGSTPSRTRLYQNGINKHWVEISALFIVQGLLNDVWVPFKRDVNYDAFLVKRKK